MINLSPYNVCEQLELGELKANSIILQLVDRYIKIPKDIVKDVLVRVDKFSNPMNFVVLDMKWYFKVEFWEYNFITEYF